MVEDRPTRVVYVSGSSEELPRVKSVMRLLHQLGVQVAHDWIRDVDELTRLEAQSHDVEVADSFVARSIHVDIEMVATAELLIALWPSEGFSAGMLLEIGVAVEHGIPLFLSARKTPPRTLGALAAIHTYSDVDLISRVLEWSLQPGSTQAPEGSVVDPPVEGER